MKKIKVINSGNLPVGIVRPIYHIIIMYLFFDHVNAPEWLYGAFGLLYFVGIVAVIRRMMLQEEVDMFKEKETDQT